MWRDPQSTNDKEPEAAKQQAMQTANDSSPPVTFHHHQPASWLCTARYFVAPVRRKASETCVLGEPRRPPHYYSMGYTKVPYRYPFGMRTHSSEQSIIFTLRCSRASHDERSNPVDATPKMPPRLVRRKKKRTRGDGRTRDETRRDSILLSLVASNTVKTTGIPCLAERENERTPTVPSSSERHRH
jgi:hypothetical protein